MPLTLSLFQQKRPAGQATLSASSFFFTEQARPFAMRELRMPAFRRDNQQGPGNKGGDEPPGGNDVEARVRKLEEAIPPIREVLARIEATLQHSATKADVINEISGTNLAVAHFRTEITRLEGSMIKWFIGTAVVLTGGIGAIALSAVRLLS